MKKYRNKNKFNGYITLADRTESMLIKDRTEETRKNIRDLSSRFKVISDAFGQIGHSFLDLKDKLK